MNIYSTITERIVKQLEKGVIPWRKTWRTGLPKSVTTGKEYRGANILVLGSEDYTSRYWVTFREAQRLGGHVRKGERATSVVYWKWRTPEELERRRQQTGKDNPAPCVPFVNAVFNLEQVEGLQRPEDDVPANPNRRLELADNLVVIMPQKPEIVHRLGQEPSYNPILDRVSLPHLSQFESGEEYYSSLFHELVHSTGHRKRLNRFTETEGDRLERYSFEELVAEFGAAFVCGFAGISSPKGEALQASYIEGWLRVFRQDERMLVRAASAAQRAADYIRGKIPLAEAGSLAA